MFPNKNNPEKLMQVRVQSVFSHRRSDRLRLNKRKGETLNYFLRARHGCGINAAALY